MLREAEVLQIQGSKMADVCRKLGISAQTYCRWRKEYGGMRVDQAKRLKELDAEILQKVRALRDLDVSPTREEADQTYDKSMAVVDRVAKITDQME